MNKCDRIARYVSQLLAIPIYPQIVKIIIIDYFHKSIYVVNLRQLLVWLYSTVHIHESSTIRFFLEKVVFL